jgi:LysR family transcriptional activator of nhaA
MIPLNYHHLYYFYVIAKEGTISKACHVLHLAQPTLSAQLKQFEKTLGNALFDRDKKKLILTEEGKTVFNYAKKIFDLGNEMQSIVQTGIIREREFVHLGVVSGMPREFSRALVSHVLKKYPKSHINLHEAPLQELILKLEDLSLDIILTETSVSPGEGIECESRQIGKIPIIFATSPELAKIYKKKIGLHAEIPFVIPTNPPQVYSQVRDLLASGKLNPKIVAEVQDVEVARLLALEKWGIAPVNKFSLQMSKPDKGLVEVDWIFPEPIYENLYLVTRKRHYPNPLANYLLDTFRL